MTPGVDDVAGFRPEEPIDPEKAAYLAEMVKRMERWSKNGVVGTSVLYRIIATYFGRCAGVAERATIQK